MKTTSVTVLKVNYNELERCINEFLKSKDYKGEEFEFVSDHECGNDSDHEFKVEPISDLDLKSLTASIKKGKLTWATHRILDYMCKEKVIEPGTYLVQVCW